MYTHARTQNPFLSYCMRDLAEIQGGLKTSFSTKLCTQCIYKFNSLQLYVIKYY